VQAQTRADPVHGSSDRELRADRRLIDHQGTVADRAPIEPDFGREVRESGTDLFPLVFDVVTPDPERRFDPGGERLVPGQEEPIFGPASVHDLVVRKPTGVRDVQAHESQVPGQPAQHLVGTPSRGEHGFQTERGHIPLAAHIPEGISFNRTMANRLFGTNGIREVVGEKLTAAFVARVAGAIAAVVPLGAPILVGRDGRTSSFALSRVVGATLAMGGHRVIEVGVLPTPAVQYLVPRLSAQLAVIVTASHNPAEFNGLKCIAADGLEVPRAVEEAIEDATEKGVAASVPYTQIGGIVSVADGGHRYVEGILAQVDVPRLRKRALTVVLDCGNGASVETSPALLRALGCRVVTLNGHLDGTFPGHPSEPTEPNTRDAQRTVPAVGADFGVIHDGDADRAVFVDHTGRYVPGEEILALLARDAVERAHGGVVVTPVSASQSLEDAIQPVGGTVFYTRIGSPAVTHAMVDQHAVFGGEENGGIITPSFQFARDGAMTLAAVLDLLARTGRPLADLLAGLPHYALVKERIPCPTELRPRVVAMVGERFEDEADKIVTIDGVKIFQEGGWILLRPSGTEPLLRLFAEAKDPNRARELADAGLLAVRDALAKLTA
jgi:phosphomannomutase / phosphoglucomutase